MSADESELETGPDDPGYLINTLAIADQVTSAVPAGTPLGWRRTTYRAVLSAILHDAVEHSTQGLEPDDVENLSRFVRNAARAAAGVGLEYAIRDNIILGAEYNYVRLSVDDRVLAPTTFVAREGSIDLQSILARISFKFRP